jgi:multicomponent Na+:H+ antiporter subunit D
MMYFIFLAPDKGEAPEIRPVPTNMKAGMIMGAVCCTVIGCFPQLLYQYLPFGPVEYVPYTMPHVLQMLQMAFMSVIPFLMFLPRMEPHTALSLDTDWFYRRPLKWLWSGISNLCFGLCRSLGHAWGVGTNQFMELCANPMKLMDARPFRQKKRYSPDNYRTSIADTIMIILTVLFICIFAFRTIG